MRSALVPTAGLSRHSFPLVVAALGSPWPAGGVRIAVEPPWKERRSPHQVTDEGSGTSTGPSLPMRYASRAARNR